MERHPSRLNNFTRNTPRAADEAAAGRGGLKRVIREPTVNRPGLALSGFTRYFAYKRVQVIGHAERFYLKSLATRSARRVTPTCSPTKSRASFSAAT
jgi:hypothetical protein